MISLIFGFPLFKGEAEKRLSDFGKSFFYNKFDNVFNILYVCTK